MAHKNARKYFRKRLFASVMVLVAGFGGFALMQDQWQWSSTNRAYAGLFHDIDDRRISAERERPAADHKAIQSALPVSLPFQEVGYLEALRPAAAGYLLNISQGRELRVRFVKQSPDSVVMFFYLYQINDDTASFGLRPIMVRRTDQFTFEPPEQGRYFLRIHVESFTDVKYSIRMESRPTLHFPVAGAGSNAVGCLYGASRGGGVRKHLGIDIFAPRNTPVVASGDGVVTRVTSERLGGKVVWMREARRGLYFYYAHLSRQLCRPGQQVKAGDTLGLIGHTGNAHSSDAHLHYGVWTGRFIDPYPYVYEAKKKPAFAGSDVRRLGHLARVKKNALMHVAPSQLSPAQKDLTAHTLLHVVQYREHWVKIRLAAGDTGFVPRHLIEPAVKPLYGVTVNKRSLLFFSSDSSRPNATGTLHPGDALLVFGRIGNSLHVRSFGGLAGWIPEMHASVVGSSVGYK